MSKYWRIRFKAEAFGEFSRRAWDGDEAGIWYGVWTPDDLEAASLRSSNSSHIAADLSALQAQRELGWEVSAGYVDAAQRFKSISNEDWVVFYLSDTQEIGLAKVQGPLRFDPKHPLNLDDGELFKYRKISDKKRFELSSLPDAYWLLPTQGRGNVHQFINMRQHVRLLAELLNADEVKRAFSLKPFDELLEALGASAWESFCFAYLIWEEDLVPTGLSIGKTLPTVDIIGRRRRNGSRIIAQCKKHSTEQPIDPEFRRLSERLGPEDTAFYFAYGGCPEDVSKNIRVIDRKLVLQWADSKNGRLYKRLLLGDTLSE